MMRRLVMFVLGVCLVAPLLASGQYQKAIGWCEQGGAHVTVPGFGPSTTYWQQSFPSCTVTVYDTGTLNLSTIFSDNSGTPKANPFTAASTGLWFFYVDNGRYDISFSGGGIGTPFTLSDILLANAARFTIIAVTYSATPAFAAADNTYFTMTLTGNVTSSTITGSAAGNVIGFRLCQDGVGGRTFSWPASFLRPPTIASAASACTNATFIYDGTNWRMLAATGDWLTPSSGITGTWPGSPTWSGNHTFSGNVIIGTDPAGVQKLRVGSGIETRGALAGESNDLTCDAAVASNCVKVHDRRTALGQAAMYVKNDGGGGAIDYQRTISGTPQSIGAVGAVGALTGVSSNQDDLGVLVQATGSAPYNGSGSFRVFTNGNGAPSNVTGAGVFNISADGTVTIPVDNAPIIIGDYSSLGTKAVMQLSNEGTTSFILRDKSYNSPAKDWLWISCTRFVAGAATCGMFGGADAVAANDLLAVNGKISSTNGYDGTVGATTPAAGIFTTVRASGQITSTVSTGTAPLVIASTTNVANLNAASVNGNTFANPGAIGGGTPATSVATSGQITSTLATGTAPLVVASTTPVANLTTVPLTYNHSGTQQTGVHIVIDSCVLGTSCAVTLTGASVFTSSSSYSCAVTDVTATNATAIAYTSGSAFTITGTGTDTLRYICVGN